MVYVELSAKFGTGWQQEVAGSPAGSLTNDLRLTHMPTPEQFPVSYIDFSILLKTIDNHWDLFKSYLPPQDLWQAKLAEVKQIRNRVAHFRRGHDDDLARVVRLMRDVDQGFFKFCTSYNDPQPILPPTRDPVVKKFLDLNQFQYTEVERHKWAMAGVADPNATINVTVDVLKRPWLVGPAPARIPVQPGYLYNVTITARGQRRFDYSQFLQDTKQIHDNVVHICLDSLGVSVRATIPAILGTRTVNTIIQKLLHWVPNALRPELSSQDEANTVQQLADEWPEYIAGPNNPLSFLAPDMKCSFFTV